VAYMGEQMRLIPVERPAPLPPRNSYLADLNSYPVTQDMLRKPHGPSVGDLIQPGSVVRTSYGTGPYIVVDIGHYSYYGVEAHSLVCKDMDGRGRYYLNELVAVDGRILKLFLANEDEVFIDPSIVPKIKRLF